MKALLTILLSIIISLHGYTQSSQNTENLLREIKYPEIENHYRLFPTKNMWTFIKLNTRNGTMWQVHFDVDGNNRGELKLNLIPLVIEANESSDRFNLYPTENIFTFILLDQIDGRVWQVQWGWEDKNRLVLPIK